MIVSCALGAYPTINAGELFPVAVTLAALGVVLVALALFRQTRFVGAALLSLVIEFLVTEATESVSTPIIIIYPVGLVVLCELVFWTRQLPSSARVDGAAFTGWLRGLASISIVSALLAVVVLVASGLQISGPFTGTIVGSVAAVVLLTLPWLLARAKHAREREREGSE